MRKLGLIGGMSWVSTRTYYEHINRLVQARTSKLASAPLLIESLDFTDLVRLSTPEQWNHAADVLTASAQRLEQAGATAILIGANSMHKVYDKVAGAVQVPVIHIADVVGQKMQANGVKTAALIGSRNVMIESFYRKRLIEHGVTLLPPVMDSVEEASARVLVREVASTSAQQRVKNMLPDLFSVGFLLGPEATPAPEAAELFL